MKSSSKGFSLVEVLLAAAIFSFLVTALIGAVIYGQKSSVKSSNHIQASMLADEAMQALVELRGNNIANFTPGAYGLHKVGNSWQLKQNDFDNTSIFTRKIYIYPIGSDSMVISSMVTWPEGNTNQQVLVGETLTNWQKPQPPKPTWANASLAGVYDVATTANGFKVATKGNYAYMIKTTGVSGGFVVVDISNPSAPVVVGTTTLATNPTNISVSGNYAYISNTSDTAEMQVVNITNPAAPTVAASYNATSTANGQSVFVSGNYAYLVRASSTLSDELEVINITNPNAPTKAGSYNNNLSMTDIAIVGNSAYIGTTSSTQNLLVVNITNPASPTLLKTNNLSPLGAVTSLRGFDNTLMVGQGINLSLFDISNPSSIVLKSKITSTGSGTINDIGAASVKNYVFLGTSYISGEFQVVDISNPSAISIVKIINTTGSNSLTGVAYNVDNDIVVGTDASDTEEIKVFRPNVP